MAWAASWIPSSRNAMATPMASPKRASAPIQPAHRPTDSPATTGAGQAGNKVTVTASANTMRLASGPAENPGIGTNATAPATRANASRNPYTVERSICSSPRILAEVAEHAGGKRDQLRRHPGQQQQQPEQERGQPRNCGETGVLDRGENLNQAHCHSHAKSDCQDGQAQPESLKKRMAKDFDCQLLRHVM